MEGISIKRQNMQSLSEYRQYLQQNPKLAYLFLELTDQCNLSCLHCGSGCKVSNRTQLDFGLVVKALDSVAKQMNPQKIMVCLTGGEPLMYQYFFELAEYVSRLGFAWGMTSNGTMITPAVADRLLECGLGSITLSLDGMPKSHDWFRGKHGSFDAAIKGIQSLQNCQNGKILLQITTVVHKQNIHELNEIYQMLSDLGIKNWRLINMEPIGRAKEHPELLLEAEDYKYLLDYIRDKRHSNKNSMEVTYGCSHFLTEKYEREVRNYYFICGAGIYVASILCNGDIASCLDIERRPELVQGNIQRDDFVDVWKHRFEIFRTNRTKQCNMCLNCEDKELCNADSFHTWNFKKQMPNLCIKRLLFG